MTIPQSFVPLIVLITVFQLPHCSLAQEFLTVRTTAYTHSEADHLRYGRMTASGSTLRAETSYTSAAADWSEFPVGTRFRIKGQSKIYVIDDYGSALVGTRTIDLYKTTKGEMNAWGVRTVEIEILEDGNFRRAKTILASRLKFAHCREMYAAIEE